MAYIETHFFSEVLGMEMEVSVILPQERQPYTEDGKIKVLWLLHGSSGDATAWTRMSSIERYALEYGIAVVLPGGMNSCFADMVHGGRFHTYLTEELPGVMRHMFPLLSSKREDNFISGYSNGGFGCFKAGLSRPDIYCAIGALSSSNKAEKDFVNDGSQVAKDFIIQFGDVDFKNTNNDVRHLAREVLKKDAPPPRIYHAVGRLDPWFEKNIIIRDFFKSFEGDPFDYKHNIAEDKGHTWEFWDTEILKFFEYLGLEKVGTKYLKL